MRYVLVVSLIAAVLITVAIIGGGLNALEVQKAAPSQVTVI